jgi:hypothetical protein
MSRNSGVCLAVRILVKSIFSRGERSVSVNLVEKFRLNEKVMHSQ